MNNTKRPGSDGFSSDFLKCVLGKGYYPRAFQIKGGDNVIISVVRTYVCLNTYLLLQFSRYIFKTLGYDRYGCSEVHDHFRILIRPLGAGSGEIMSKGSKKN